MTIWDKLKTPPPWALKKITGGRLNGKTDINPQWRYQAMTEVFGPCGIGWKYEIVDRWTEEAAEGQRLVFAAVNLYIKHDGQWSDPIPGVGGDMSLVKEKSGIHVNDEAYKMATTDALGNALKMIGVAATVYSNFNDTKYSRSDKQEPVLSETKMKHLMAVAGECGFTDAQIKLYIGKHFGKDSKKQLTEEEADKVIASMKAAKQ